MTLNPPALAVLLAAVGDHVTGGRRMVVNAIGAGRITVIGRSLRAHWMQFFLCNHAHVVPIAIAVLLGAACFSETKGTMEWLGWLYSSSSIGSTSNSTSTIRLPSHLLAETKGDVQIEVLMGTLVEGLQRGHARVAIAPVELTVRQHRLEGR